MTADPKRQTEFQEGRGYARGDWDAVSDNPELTQEEMAQARPFAEVFPEWADQIRKAGRPRLERPKKLVSLRLDPDVIEKFKATGRGWQSRINEVLKAAKL
ncbi:MAG TPA: BrnA antitoxin family protein [Mesorhizobium sp.]|jgi:uncharacterized protein (DUF4415 family)|nr:BrnA antitoxin family protein [Mesorhizobium sp.]